MKSQASKNVDAYIAGKPAELTATLEQLRAIIRAAVPNAEEVISYMIPCYKLQGMLVGFGVHKKGCSFYTMNPKILSRYAEELKGFEYTGSTLHLDPKKKVPVALLKKIIKARIKENEDMTALKRDLKLNK